jgi:hypothetical protein
MELSESRLSHLFEESWNKLKKKQLWKTKAVKLANETFYIFN